MACPSVSAHPYAPSHDPQKLMRASLATSCFRGAMHVWQFQDGGVQGKELRATRWRGFVSQHAHLMRCGQYLRVAELFQLPPIEPALGVVSNVCSALGRAVAHHHFGMVESLLRDATTPRPAEPANCSSSAHQSGQPALRDVLWSAGSLPDTEPGCFTEPLLVRYLLWRSVQTEWSWGVNYIEEVVVPSHLLESSTEQEALVGETTPHSPDRCSYALAMICAAARAGTPGSLGWVEHLCRRYGDICGALHHTEVLGRVCGSCTLEVAEFLATQFRGSPSNCSRAIMAAIRGSQFAVLEWLVRRSNPAFLDTQPTIDAAARQGNLAIARYLLANKLGHATQDAFRCAVHHSAHALPMLEWLHENLATALSRGTLQRALVPANTLKMVVLRSRVDILDFLLKQPGIGRTAWTPRLANIVPASGNRVQLLEYCARTGLLLPQSVDRAATVGALDVVRWLHRWNPDIACSASALDEATAHGMAHVEFLLQNFFPLGGASANHKTASTAGVRSPFSGEAMAQAAAHGRVDVMRWLWQTGLCLSCSSDVITSAAGGGHLEALEFVKVHCPHVACTPAALEVAAQSGACDVIEWLTAQYPLVECTQAAMNTAVMNGRVRVLELLLRFHCQRDASRHYGGQQLSLDLKHATQSRATHMVRFLVEHNLAPITNDVLLQTALGQPKLHRYLTKMQAS